MWIPRWGVSKKQNIEAIKKPDELNKSIKWD